MKLIIVRHGETEWNEKGIIMGHSDIRLNKKGREQARKVAKRLKWMKIDFAYVSDLIRAKETAGEILKYHPKTKVYYLRGLREASKGILEGKAREEVKKMRINLSGNYLEQKVEGGENHLEVRKRVISAYKKIIRKHTQGTVLIVTHNGPIRVIYDYALNKKYDSKESYWEYHPENCAVTILEIDGKGKHKVKALNCVKHLTEKTKN